MSEDTEAKVLRGHILDGRSSKSKNSYACRLSTLPMTQEICVSKERRCAQRPPFHSRCFEGTVIAAGNRAMIKPSEFTLQQAIMLARMLAEIFPHEQIA